MIEHIEAIINIFKKYEIIEYEYSALIDKQYISDLEQAITNMLKVYKTDILSQYKKVEAYLKDVSGNEISDYDIQSFVVFLKAINAENVVLSFKNERSFYFMKVLSNSLQKLNLWYEPLYDHNKWS